MVIVDKLFRAIPGTTVVVSTLIPSLCGTVTANKYIYNNDLRNDVASRRVNGQKIVLAEIDNGFLTLDDLQDELHPTDAGYRKMPSVWWQAIQDADSSGFLTAPGAISVAGG
jgi:hypothetical protein